jgi:hypothetical protein
MELFAGSDGTQGGSISEGHEGTAQTRTGSAWDPLLTRRLRVLLHTAPLHDLRLSDSRRDPDLRHYDSLALALKTLDVIIESMGLDREVDRGTVVRSLSPLMRAMDVAMGITPDPRRHAAMVDRLLAGLRNDAEGRRSAFRPWTRRTRRPDSFSLPHTPQDWQWWCGCCGCCV